MKTAIYVQETIQILVLLYYFYITTENLYIWTFLCALTMQ